MLSDTKQTTMNTLDEFDAVLQYIINFTDSRGCLGKLTKEESIEIQRLHERLDSMTFTSDMIIDKEVMKRVKIYLDYGGNGGAISDEQYDRFHKELLIFGPYDP